ncbi:MAG: cation diffusion facilitator family transporter [Clostridiales Family XIII bacterium]|jgi:cation diffusion facilitator family transporter|nr:cation diffusion facilitator family transporter [Clostridiales Family XIII bacterium]
MTKFLIRIFIDGKGGSERGRRERSGRLSGVVGILLNLLLGFVKIFAGVFTGSVAVTADAVNNLSDAAASVITIVGFRMASQKADAEHPFGHARIEYMTGVIVSALVIVVGIKLILESYEKVAAPSELHSSPLIIILLIIMIFAKIWLWRFNKALAEYIGSASIKATGDDSRNDAISTAAVLLTLVLHQLGGVNIDGYVGLAVGVFIIYSGLNLVKETAGPLLGQSPDPATVKGIEALVMGHAEVLGIHDLIVHDYGPGHVFASVHIEVDSREDVFKSHTVIDDIEREAQDLLGVLLVGHMDPLDTQNPRLRELRELLGSALRQVEGVMNIHDLRIVAGENRTNVIFDIVVSHEQGQKAYDAAMDEARRVLAELDPAYIPIANCDTDFGTN